MRVKAETDQMTQVQPQGDQQEHTESQHGYTSGKDEYTARLRRIEGQVRGLQRMIAEDKYCIDILTQVSAATRALQSVALGLLSDHLAHCVAQAVADGGPAADEKLREATAAIARLVRS
ncbi:MULTISPECIES: metal-sensitive transcriptional regulator [unclassified Frankia]|uniref:metal-sensitive transcriptional regulator n=1 Tax=unclassified Frankia TaxID=2632575 RepID=UPI000A673074|nr:MULTISPECIES: metal-sensitive transcriptional regulator [unclassified Frankia]